MAQPDLALVAEALNGPSFLPGARQGWQKERGQYTDDCHHHKQLD